MGSAHQSFDGVFLRHRHQDRGIIEISIKLITFILHQIMCSLRSSSLVHSAYRNGALRLPKSGALQITDHKASVSFLILG